MILLNTERLVLRNVRLQDADIVFDYRNNPLCARYQRGQTKDYAGIAELLKEHEKDQLTVHASSMVAVALRDSDEMVGEIVVMPNDGTISLGYTFSYKHHRKGYAYESLRLLTDTLHRQNPDWDFISFTEPDNTASRNLLKKLGYMDMGYIPSMESQVYGKWTTPETNAEIAQAVVQT